MVINSVVGDIVMERLDFEREKHGYHNFVNYTVRLIDKISRSGGDINEIVDSKGNSIAHICPDNLDIVKAFVEAGGDLNAKNKDDETALHKFFISAGNHIYGKKQEFERNSSLNFYKDLATKSQSFLELFEFYLKAGADPNIKEKVRKYAWKVGFPLKEKEKRIKKDWVRNKSIADRMAEYLDEVGDEKYAKQFLEVACKYNMQLSESLISKYNIAPDELKSKLKQEPKQNIEEEYFDLGR